MGPTLSKSTEIYSLPIGQNWPSNSFFPLVSYLEISAKNALNAEEKEILVVPTTEREGAGHSMGISLS